MYVKRFLSKFHDHMFITLKVISALQKKKKKREKSKRKEKHNYDRAFGNLCIFVYQ